MKHLVLYIPGKDGNGAEAAHYAPLFPDSTVIGFDYTAQNPWEAKDEFSGFFDAHCTGYDSVTLIANSIGAFFAMNALAEKPIHTALMISPVVNMERLIGDMMGWATVTEDDLRTRGEIPTDFGETLSWEYLCYVRNHPIHWAIPTHILYGARDHLTARETVTAFANEIGATLTVMEDGEHWFHTEEQMAFLNSWVEHILSAKGEPHAFP